MFSSNPDQRVGETKSHHKLCPGVVRPRQPQISSMQSCQFAREIQPQAMAGDVFADRSPMEALEDSFLNCGGNGATCVRNRKFDALAITFCPQTKLAIQAIVLAGVFQEISNDHGRVSLFALNP